MNVRTALLAALAALLLIAAGTDIRSRIIPNRLNAAVVALAIGWWWASGYDVDSISIQIGAAFGALVLFGCFFAVGAMGGGDVKLIVALALFLPPPTLLKVMVWTAIGGGFLTLFMIVAHRLRRLGGQPEIPYGVAIAAAALLGMANDILTTTAA